MIYKITRYVDDEGKSVSEYVPEVDVSDKDQVYYEGVVGLQTPMGPQPLSFTFPSDFKLVDCFNRFDEIAKIEVKRILEDAKKKEMEQNLIITPNQMQNNNTIH